VLYMQAYNTSYQEPYRLEVSNFLSRVSPQELTLHRMHVFSDIRPYICTSSSCQQPLCTFATRQDWAEHEFKYHSREIPWLYLKDLASRDHRTNSLEHFDENAPNRKNQPTLDGTTIDLSCPLSCPLCQTGLGCSKRSYISHVAKHMESIALAVLPAEPEEVSDDESSANEIQVSTLTTSFPASRESSKQSQATLTDSMASLNRQAEKFRKKVMQKGVTWVPQDESESSSDSGRYFLRQRTRTTSSSVVSSPVCFKCGEKGHSIYACPTAQSDTG
jgi:hypothetical protein